MPGTHNQQMALILVEHFFCSLFVLDLFFDLGHTETKDKGDFFGIAANSSLQYHATENSMNRLKYKPKITNN